MKTQRQIQDLTQQSLADSVGVTRQSLARIERGHGGASFETVLRIFETLGIRLDATANAQTPSDDPRPTSRLPKTIHDLIRGVHAPATHTASHLSARSAQRARLNAAIEAADPDREKPTASGENSLADLSGSAGNG
ncbi:helix-turn-helix transcriptional regulator [Microbacterium amylolyticum]|uniref:helix-turn-helix transcriptional regulator n=1 Tax=Microbacterium amylolyticum TaxID=936337 RepID=UPI00360F1A2E